MDHEQRRRVRCAWVPVSERLGHALIPPDYPYERPDICCGYLSGLPEVIEAARAASWRREGALGQFYTGPIGDKAKLAIDLMAGEFKAVEQDVIRKSREG